MRTGEIARGEKERFDQDAWRREMKEWNRKSGAEKGRIIEQLKKERQEKRV